MKNGKEGIFILHFGHIKYLPIELALDDIVFVEADEYLERRIKNGAILNNFYAERIVGFKNRKNEIIAIYQIYDKDNTKIKPLKVFIKSE